MHNLQNFDLRDMAECAAALRKSGTGADSLPQVAGRMLQIPDDNFHQSDGPGSCAVVSFGSTQRCREPTTKLPRFANQRLAGRPPAPNPHCLTPLATVGEAPDWGTTHKSQQRRAIPLGSEPMMAQSPTISRPVQQFSERLPTGALFAVNLFSNVKVHRPTAELLRILALSIKATNLPYSDRRLFR